MCPAMRLEECQCRLPSPCTWGKGGDTVVIYSCMGLVGKGRLLLNYREIDRLLFGMHMLKEVTAVRVFNLPKIGKYWLAISSEFHHWGMGVQVSNVGLIQIRMIQRWWRRRFCDRILAFMMISHPRLGYKSPGHVLEAEILQMCCS